jgi:hypothetical protein
MATDAKTILTREALLSKFLHTLICVASTIAEVSSHPAVIRESTIVIDFLASRIAALAHPPTDPT